MRIAIDSRGANLYSGTGIGTYTRNLISELINIKNDNKYTLIWTGDNKEDFLRENTNLILCSGKHGGFFERNYIPNLLEHNEIDLYHIPQNGIGFPFESSLNTVVTIHDLIPYIMPETVGTGYLNRFLRDMPNIIENSKGILTVSEYSKRDILKFFKGYKAENIYVTPLAANYCYKPLDKDICEKKIKKLFNFNSPYILYIGGFSSRKNVKELIDAFINVKSSLSKPYKLLICGSLKDEGEKLLEYTKTNDTNESIIFTGFIEDSLLPTLYNGAKAFVYPSLYEGFGLPPLEAMSCMTPVISSNRTSIPEVTGDDGAILINPDSSDELSESIYKLLENTELQKAIAKKGYEKSLQFSWRQTAKNTLLAYENIFSNSI